MTAAVGDEGTNGEVPMEAAPRSYPSIAQSWGIFGIVVGMSVLSAATTALERWITVEGVALVSYVFAMGLSFWIIYAMRRRRTGKPHFEFRISSPVLFVPLALGSVALLYGVSAPIAGLIPVPEFAREWLRGLVVQTGPMTFVYFVLAAPVLEELIFRGIMLDGLLDRYRPLTAILVSSFMFGIVHMNPYQFVAAFLMGCFVGWIYLHTRSVGACIVVHMAGNLAGFIQRFFTDADTMFETERSVLQSFGGGGAQFILVELGLLIVLTLSIVLLKRRYDAMAPVGEESA